MKRSKINRALAWLLCLTFVITTCEITMKKVSAANAPLITYSGHQQNYGNLDKVSDGAILGVTGQSKRLEAITINKGSGLSGLSGDIECQAHIQNIGDTDWIPSGKMVGTSGRSLRIEALRMRLTGQLAEEYDIYYSLHIQNIGWTCWVKGIKDSQKEGGWCGSRGMSKRVEAIKIKLVPISEDKPDNLGDFTYYSTDAKDSKLTYSGHQQNYGDLPAVTEGKSLGVTGKSKRLEAISIKLNDSVKTSAEDGITYRVHVQNHGWMDWKSNGALAGTTGESKRIEAIEIKLTGPIANKYDVYYRVHAQNFGWMGWTKNGSSAGSTGISKRVEAIEIRMVPKGLGAPGSTAKAFSKIDYSGKLIALTFDDGPGPRTNEVLNCLEKNDAHATFYVVGTNAAVRPSLIGRMEEIGCEVGNHSASHCNFKKKTTSEIHEELNMVNRIVRAQTGHDCATVRTPGGNYDNKVLAAVDAPVILWSIDTLDWKTRSKKATIDAVLNKVQDGDIILMHDIHTSTVDAALYLIPELKRRGYTLVTVSELAEARGISLNDGEVYKNLY